MRRCLSACLLGLSGAALAAADAPFQISVGQRLLHDSNLLRTRESARSDRVSTTTLGATFDTEQSRQRLRFSAAGSVHRYDRLGALDHTGRDLAASWLWRAGSRLEGEANASERVALTPFQDFRPAQPLTTASKSTSRGASVTGHAWLLADWSVGGGAGAASTRYSAAELAPARYHASYGEAIARYRPATGSAITARYRRTEGRYPERIAPSDARLSRAFIQDELLAETSWRASAASRVDASLGVAQRRVGDFVGPVGAPRASNFRGVAGRLAYDWQLSGATGVNLALTRGAQPVQSAEIDYAVVTSVALVPTWAPSPAVRLQPRLERQYRDLKGGTAEGQRDRLDVAELRITYTPLPRLEIGVAAARERRSADNPALAFRASVYLIEGRYAMF